MLVFDPFVSFAAFLAAASSQKPPSDDLPITLTTLTLGLLISDGVEGPPVIVVPQHGNNTGSIAQAKAKSGEKTLYPDWEHPRGAKFTREFFRAVGEARSYGPLADKVLALLGREGYLDARRRHAYRPLRGIRQGHAPACRHEGRRGRAATASPGQRDARQVLQNVGFEDRIADSTIDLPDLDEIQDENIIAENVA